MKDKFKTNFISFECARHKVNTHGCIVCYESRKDKFKRNPFAKSYKSDLTQEVKVFDYKHTGFPVMFFSKVSYVLFFLAVGMIIGTLM